MTPPSEGRPVIGPLEGFDPGSGGLGERLMFKNRLLVILACLAASIFLAFQSERLPLDAGFEKMIPSDHPFVREYRAHAGQLKGLGNSIRIVVEAKHGSIFEPGYLETLRRINDDAVFLPGCDRAAMKSLWTPATRWAAVVEGGLEGGPIIPDGFDGSPASVEQVRANVARSQEIGVLVAADYKSTVVLVPLLDRDPATGNPLSYRDLATATETLRRTYNSSEIAVHIVGFAQVLGDLIAGLRQVVMFFVTAFLLTTLILYWYTRCLRSTVLVVTCSLVAVVWQLGLMRLLGYGLDPYSILVPFLVFSIGVSHGAQKMNGIMQDIGRGAHRLVAARLTFRRLFTAGLTALLCDAVGFAVLALIHIKVIQELAVMASIGVGVLVFTNLVLLPILLSYFGVAAGAAARSLRAETAESFGNAMWLFLARLTDARRARVVLAATALLALGGFITAERIKIGDQDPGAPELTRHSRYNRDNDFVLKHFAASSDLLVVMVSTPANHCVDYKVLSRIDALEGELRRLPGVEATNSLAALSKRSTVGLNEGSLKWFELLPNQSILNAVATRAPRELFNQACDFQSVFVYLADHQADTLSRVVAAVQAFADRYNDRDARFLLAAGNAGFEAATNIVVKKAKQFVLVWLFAAVASLCFVAFRSWRPVVVAILPLMLTSVLCEALMVLLGIGVKVATLPVIALGVGIGVDYALYVLSVTLAELRAGRQLAEAYRRALRFTGRVVLLTGVTFAIGVGTWVLSPIKFQADMGMLLTFMFLWNMVSALVLTPALLAFLLNPARAARAAQSLGSPRTPLRVRSRPADEQGLERSARARALGARFEQNGAYRDGP